VVRPGAAGDRGGVKQAVRDRVIATGWRVVVGSGQERRGAWMGWVRIGRVTTVAQAQSLGLEYSP